MLEDTLKLDVETDIELGLLDPPPWGNPKSPIHGVYRQGLSDSLVFFGLRDRLKVWPNPDHPGRYIVLNGNQRIDTVREICEYDMIAEHFNFPEEYSVSDIRKIKNDPEHDGVIRYIQQKVYGRKMPSQIITQFRNGQKFTRHHAIQFVLAWDRNHAKPDEAAYVRQHREAREALLAELADERKARIDRMLSSMARPQPVFLMPKEEAAIPSPSPVKDEDKFNSEYVHERPEQDDDSPWGPPPEDVNTSSSDSDSPTPPLATPGPGRSPGIPKPPLELYPMFFSFTKEGYEEIQSSILRSKSHMFRETRLKAALEKLSSLLAARSASAATAEDSIVTETALVILNKHIEIEENRS